MPLMNHRIANAELASAPYSQRVQLPPPKICADVWWPTGWFKRDHGARLSAKRLAPTKTGLPFPYLAPDAANPRHRNFAAPELWLRRAELPLIDMVL
jgi:hypothetical protein